LKNDLLYCKPGHRSFDVMKSIGYTLSNDSDFYADCCVDHHTREYPRKVSIGFSSPFQLFSANVSYWIFIFLTWVHAHSRYTGAYHFLLSWSHPTSAKQFNLIGGTRFQVQAVRFDTYCEFCSGRSVEYYFGKLMHNNLLFHIIFLKMEENI